MAQPAVPEITASGNAPFPRDEKDFDHDPRVSFSRLSETFILEAEDSTEYEWDKRVKRWIPVLDEALLEQQQAAYRIPGEEETTQDPRSRKRDAEDGDGEEPIKKKKKKPEKAPVERKNKAVYITHLPLDTTVSELESTFSKYGLIADSIDDSSKRIKLYKDEDGNFKGDALVVYFRPESVQLAIQMLDDTELRLGSNEGTIKVQAASMEFKSQKEPSTTTTNDKEKKRIIKKLQRQNNRLADWSSDDDIASAPVQPSKWDKVVILSHMFTLAELAEDPGAILDIKADIREECEKLGEVTNVVLYDLEEEGIVSVRFKDENSAKRCVQVMNGRFFGGVQCEAGIARGSEKFQKSGKESVLDEPDEDGNGDGQDEDEKRRLEKFGSWLEGGEKEMEEEQQ